MAGVHIFLCEHLEYFKYSETYTFDIIAIYLFILNECCLAYFVNVFLYTFIIYILILHLPKSQMGDLGFNRVTLMILASYSITSLYVNPIYSRQTLGHICCFN